MKKNLLALSILLGLVTIGEVHTQASEVTEGSKTFYIVERGDTLSGVADTYNTTYTDLHKKNSYMIKDPNMIYVGQKLFITDKDKESESPINTDYYKEETGEEAVAIVYPDNAEEAYDYSEKPTNYVGDSNSAKEWIAERESGGDYNATNGYHIGRYQLDPSYLNGDHSPENQEKVADDYVSGRYGSWENAQEFWMNNGWY